MSISSAAASAVRELLSLEREDQSLFPACLLELFLSHISTAKSPPFFSPSQPVTHDLYSHSESAGVRSAAPLVHKNEFKCPWQNDVFSESPVTVTSPRSKFRKLRPAPEQGRDSVESSSRYALTDQLGRCLV